MWGGWSGANAENRPASSPRALPRVCAFFSTAHLSVDRPDILPPNTDSVLTVFLFSFFASFLLSSSYYSSTHHFSLPSCPSSPSSFVILRFFLLWPFPLLHPPLKPLRLTFPPHLFPSLPPPRPSPPPFSLLVSPAIGFLSPLVSRGQRQWVPAHASDQSRAAGLPSHCW